MRAIAALKWSEFRWALPAAASRERLDQEIHAGIVGTARPFEADGSRFGAASGGEALDQAGELLGILGPDRRSKTDHSGRSVRKL
jgi:hypothetical protein